MQCCMGLVYFDAMEHGFGMHAVLHKEGNASSHTRGTWSEGIANDGKPAGNRSSSEGRASLETTCRSVKM
jgi:hypothetical protein